MRAWRDLRGGTPRDLNDPKEVRQALLDFIADFSNWDNSNDKDFLETSRALVQCAHESLGGAPGTRPLVVDPFAGGGAIPLEALRVGADAFASDVNPVAVLLNKVVLEYIPKYGQRLADEVRKWGDWVKHEAEKDLVALYPKDPDGAMPIAYLWARTIKCEGPGCGAEVPLVRSLRLGKRGDQAFALAFRKERSQGKKIKIDLVESSARDAGTVRKGSATCPICSYTTPLARAREQLRGRRGGSHDARLLAVVVGHPGQTGKSYRLPNENDIGGVARATELLRRLEKSRPADGCSAVPSEPISTNELRRISLPLYGMENWRDLFTPRQLVALTTFSELVERARKRMLEERGDPGLAEATATCLALVVDKQADRGSSLCQWDLSSAGGRVGHTFVRQALGMVWDFVEPSPFAEASGDFGVALDGVIRIIDQVSAGGMQPGHVSCISATKHPLPDDTADALVTDPPYYDAVPYAHLSDFFYVWLRRSLRGAHAALLGDSEIPKAAEIVVDRPHEKSTSQKTIEFYEAELTKAFSKGREVLRPLGVAVVVFASKTTASWEAILGAIVDSGFVISGSWPIDTELENRLAAQGQARLASSIHIVCRPRENPDGSLRTDEIGDWRDVLAALPKRIHEWMPRLRDEGIVGADAIFACLGPALEIFSRYSKVEKASGEVVTLKEYLEHVWAAVAKEALAVIFSGADTAAFEEDARLTAMWLWTLNGGAAEGAEAGGEDAEIGDDDADTGGSSAKAGFELEYDAARKIAQGLGAHLEDLTTLVAVKGSTARLLPVAERATSLFGQPETPATAPGAKKKRKQLTLGFVADGEADAKASSGLDGKLQAKPGTTVLDRVHQAMILFGAGRGEALRRFLVDDGAGKDDRFWRLGQALAALYPTGTDERRFIEGVMARKKGLGL